MRIDVSCYEPTSVNIPYKKTYPWKIPIRVMNYNYKGEKNIEVEITGQIDFDVETHIKQIFAFYEEKRWTVGLSDVSLGDLTLRINILEEFITNRGKEHKGNDGLHLRGAAFELFPEAYVEISKAGCKEILTSYLNDNYKNRHKSLATKFPWTFKGWIKHTLAHEIAHLVCVPRNIYYRFDGEHLSDIISQICATHYDITNEPFIYVPSGDYLKGRWRNLKINPDNCHICSKTLENAFQRGINGKKNWFDDIALA